ncbi:MAG: MarR family transcriptional regulator [Akkermansia sp.]|nr:MarR family transcriptional regulator [Akkermansia sp.]
MSSGSQTPFANDHRHVSYMMKMIVDRMDTLFQQKMGPIPVTAPQCRLLMYLDSRRGAPVSQRELEHYLGVSHTTVKGLLSRLEEKGYVRTAFDNAADARVKNAYLTEKYHRSHADARAVIERFEAEITRGLSEAEQAAMKELLARIYANLLPSD